MNTLQNYIIIINYYESRLEIIKEGYALAQHIIHPISSLPWRNYEHKIRSS